jgi:hypothetical protein
LYAAGVFQRFRSRFSRFTHVEAVYLDIECSQMEVLKGALTLLDYMRDQTWTARPTEDSLIPSAEALYYHYRR